MRSFFEDADIQAFWAQLTTVLEEIAFVDEVYAVFGMRPEIKRKLLLPYDDFLIVHNSDGRSGHRLNWGYTVKTGERTKDVEPDAFRIAVSANVALSRVAGSVKQFELSYDSPETGYMLQATPAIMKKLAAMDRKNKLAFVSDGSRRRVSAQEACLLCRHLARFFLANKRSRRDSVPDR